MSLFSTAKSRFLILCFGLALLMLVLDQLTKHLVVETFQTPEGQPIMYEEYEVTSFFKITRRHNCGVAFSMGKQSHFWDCRDIGMQRWVLAAFVFVVSIVLAVWITRLNREKLWEALGLALILGGALGNLVDRVLLGYVVDFIVVHHQSWPWPEFPSFNIADSAITVGAGLLLIDMFYIQRKKQQVEEAKNGN